MRRSVAFATVTVLAIVATLLFALSGAGSGGLVINEISFANGDGRDWVEIYNQSNHNLTLDGLYLSDTEDDLTRYRFRRRFVVPAGGLAIIYGDRDSSSSPDPAANFNIKAGETVYLVARDGATILDSIDIPDDAPEDGSSYGRQPDASDTLVFLDVQTPSRPNHTGSDDG